MKRFVIAVAAAAGLIALVASTGLLWDIFGPSVIRIRNVGDQPVQLVVTDALGATPVWSGQLGPGHRKTVFVRFQHEGGPELRCRDDTSSNTAPLGYVTGHMPLKAEIEIAGCDHMNRKLSY